MKTWFRGKSIVCVALVLVGIAFVPACQASSASKQEKHARKIEKRLAKFKPGSYLEFDFRNGSEATGNLITLSESTFTFTNSDSNAKETHPYGDVSEVKKGKTYIGAGSTAHHHRIHIF